MPKNTQNKKYTFIIIGFTIILITTLSVIFINYKTPQPQDTSSSIDNNNYEKTDTYSEETSSQSNEINKNRFEGLTLVNDNRGVPVLYYHSVDPSEANEVIIDPNKLREQLQFIKDSGYTTLTISELNDYIKNEKPIPEKSIVITFDDGYRDNYVYAFPMLKELDMKATFFIITNVIDDGYYMTAEQLKEMSDYGMDIESHTLNHLHLNELSYEQQLEELKASKERLESITGKPVLSFAYPYGDRDENSKKAAIEAGYSIGFTTDLGYSDREDNPITLDRIYVSSSYTMDQFKDRLINIKK